MQEKIIGKILPKLSVKNLTRSSRSALFRIRVPQSALITRQLISNCEHSSIDFYQLSKFQ